MLNYLVYLILVLTIALTAGAIILTTRLRSRYKTDFFSTLLYFLVFIFTFGFYGIWGQVIIKVFLTSYISADLLLRITGIAMLLGLPFLVFAWLMLIQFSLRLTGRKKSSLFIAAFLLVNFLLVFGVGFFISRSDEKMPLYLIKIYFIIMNSLYSLAASLIIWFHRKGSSYIHDYDRRIIAPSLLLIAAIQCIPLIFYTSQIWLGIVFIMTFFIGNTFLPLYLTYGTLLSAFEREQPDASPSFDLFCTNYEVSPRESEIIREICNGLSNKEISDKLFISLQTVKDHTHRIYIKTNVKSRVQLINKVKVEAGN